MSTSCSCVTSRRGHQFVALVLLAAAVVLAGCGGSGESGRRFDASADARRYPIEGEVRAVHVADQTLAIAHEPIAGLMDAMTMDFQVQDVWVLQAAAPGDRITGTLVLDGARSWVEGIAIVKGNGTSGPGAGSGLPAIAGVTLPDVTLVNQQGVEVRPSTYTGRADVYTFIYTRCPMPDYCPLMMQRLNEVAARLSAGGRRDDVWLVAVTLDPAYDTPAVLEGFGDRHIVETDSRDRYARRALLTGDPDAIRTLASTFQLTWDEQDGEIIHGLRTVVVDAEGRVRQVFRGNDWSVDDLLGALPAAGERP